MPPSTSCQYNLGRFTDPTRMGQAAVKCNRLGTAITRCTATSFYQEATGCGVNSDYALSVPVRGSTESVETTRFRLQRQQRLLANSGAPCYGSKTIRKNPGFTNPVAPAAPNCQTETNVTTEWRTVIADFAPAAVSAKASLWPARRNEKLTKAKFNQ